MMSENGNKPGNSIGILLHYILTHHSTVHALKWNYTDSLSTVLYSATV